MVASVSTSTAVTAQASHHGACTYSSTGMAACSTRASKVAATTTMTGAPLSRGGAAERSVSRSLGGKSRGGKSCYSPSTHINVAVMNGAHCARGASALVAPAAQ